MLFKERLKDLRINSNYSQVELAKLINKTDRAIRTYESGKSEPTLSILLDLSDLFNVSIDYLVGRTDNPEINR